MLTKEQLDYKMAILSSIVSDMTEIVKELCMIHRAQEAYLKHVLEKEDESEDEYNKNNKQFCLKISERKTKLLIATLRHNCLVEELKNAWGDLRVLKTISCN